MINKNSFNFSENTLSFILIPAVLFLANTNILDKIPISKDFDEKVNLLRDVKPYFSVKEQYLLSKVEDIFDILNKVTRIQKNEYEDEISTSTLSYSNKEKKERILRSMVNHLDGNNRELLQKVIETNEKIEQTKDNFEKFKTQNISKMDFKSIVKLISCFKPLYRDINNGTIRKIDRIIDILNNTD